MKRLVPKLPTKKPKEVSRALSMRQSMSTEAKHPMARLLVPRPRLNRSRKTTANHIQSISPS
jgi:hypothetical protein